MERSSRAGGGPAQGYSYQETSSRHYTSSTSMGAKRAGGAMEAAVLGEKRNEQESMRARSDSLVSDLSSIAKVRSVSRSTHHSTER